MVEQNFDPMTGKPLKPDSQPVTNPEYNFDPNTGAKITDIPETPEVPGFKYVEYNFDPVTGQPIDRTPVKTGGAGKVIALVAGGVVALSALGFVASDMPFFRGPVEPTVYDVDNDDYVEPKDDTDGTPVYPTDGNVLSADDAEDLFSFTIDDRKYELPIQVSVLIDDGWEFNDDNDATILMSSNSYEFVYLNMPGTTTSISVSVTNFSLDAMELQDCYVTGFSINRYILDNEGMTGRYYDDYIVLGESTYDDCIDIIGTPSSQSENIENGYVVYRMETESYFEDASAQIGFDEDGVVSYVVLNNNVIPEDFEQAEVQTFVPDYLSNYEAPEALGDDPLSGNFQLDGVVYNLPVPIQVFIDNGWDVDDEESVVGAGQAVNVTMRKGNETVYILTSNQIDKAVYLKNTIVVQITVYNSNYSGADMLFPGGLTVSDTDEHLKGILSDNGITNYQYKKDYKNYTVPLDQTKDPEKALNVYNIHIDDNGYVGYIDFRNYGWLFEE